jgi:hypothetical protein
VLEPLLFLIYVNDMPNAIPREKLKLFADGTNLLISSRSVIDLNHMAIVSVHNLNNWMNNNELHLSIGKPIMPFSHLVKQRLITNLMLK